MCPSRTGCVMVSYEDDLTVSWSRLRAWEECKSKAHLRASGFRNNSGNIRIFAPGTISDIAMREFLTDPSRPMRDYIPEVMDKHEEKAKATGEGIIRWKNTSDREDVRRWCQRLSDEFQPILEEMVLPYDFEVGKRFKATIQIPNLEGEFQKIHLIGEMDLFVDHEDIWDLKATEDESYWRKTSGQITFYDVVKHALTGSYMRAGGLFQPMCKMKVRPIVPSDEDRHFLVSKIVQYAHSVWRKDFAPKADKTGCDFCDVKHACPKFAVKPGSRKISLLGG